MPFECKKHHAESKARCCGIVPFKVRLWKAKQHLLQRNVKNVIEGSSNEGKVIIPITEDHSCPFLKKDLACAIYEDRPKLCKKYGDDSHILMSCPMQKADSTPRTTKEKKDLQRDQHTNMKYSYLFNTFKA